MMRRFAVSDSDTQKDQFIALSSILTGYDEAELHATGCVDEYWSLFARILPEPMKRDFLEPAPTILELRDRDPERFDRTVRTYYLSRTQFGAPSRSLIQLWFLGQWTPLPQIWREEFGDSRFDISHIISTRSYKEGLVWDTIGAHPMGAKQQGFGAWATEPPQMKE